MAKPRQLYADFAFGWMFSGITTVRARSQAEAEEKFRRLSRASMLNQARGTNFTVAAIGEDTPAPAVPPLSCQYRLGGHCPKPSVCRASGKCNDEWLKK